VFGFGPATGIYLRPRDRHAEEFQRSLRLVRDHLGCDSESGHVFLFANARRNRLKLLVYDGSGLWVCSKKLDGGCFRWPGTDSHSNKIVLGHEELTLSSGWYRSEAKRVAGHGIARDPKRNQISYE